jgi:hypothetical protein
MASRFNKHGLADYIPSEVRLAVRQQCGFGCVVCGLAIAQYEHFDPPFEEAREHRAEGICLLCGACHDKKTRGIWSPAKVAAARSSPITFAKGGSKDAFDLAAPLALWIGDSLFLQVNTIVRTREGEQWLSIESSELPGGPVRISAKFFDDRGAPSLTIEGNEWMPSSSQWDTEVIGKTIKIRRSVGEVVLQLVAVPPNGLRLSRLRMRRHDLAIEVTTAGLVILERAGGKTVLKTCTIDGADTAFLL